MGQWRKRFARRRAEEGFNAALFVGLFIAALVVGLGVVCLVMDRIPIGTRNGLIWIGPPRKDTIGGFFVFLGAALHLWFFWGRPGGPRRIASVAALAALLAAAGCFLATLR